MTEIKLITREQWNNILLGLTQGFTTVGDAWKSLPTLPLSEIMECLTTLEKQCNSHVACPPVNTIRRLLSEIGKLTEGNE